MALVSILIGKLVNKPKKGPEIGGFVIDVSVSESHEFEAEPTENPVEVGIDVTDHVDLKPKKLNIEGIVSDTPLNLQTQVAGLVTGAGALIGKKIGGNLGAVAGGVGAGALLGLLKGKDNRVKNAYDHFQDLMSKRVPFTVITGLKRYENMMITSLSIKRDATTGRALKFSVSLREIRIVQSKIVNLKNTFGAVANGAQKKSDLGRQSTQETSSDNKTILRSLLS